MSAYDSWLSNNDDYADFCATTPRWLTLCCDCKSEFAHPQSQGEFCIRCEIKGLADHIVAHPNDCEYEREELPVWQQRLREEKRAA